MPCRELRVVLSVVFYVVNKNPQNRIRSKSCRNQKKTPEIRTVTGFCHALCTFIELYANQTVSPVMFHKTGSRRRRVPTQRCKALPVGCPR